jgi:hypothetical protein
MLLSNLTVDSTSWLDGQLINFTYNVENIGTQVAADSASGLYLSTNTVISTADTLLLEDLNTGTMSVGEINPEGEPNNFVFDSILRFGEPDLGMDQAAPGDRQTMQGMALLSTRKNACSYVISRNGGCRFGLAWFDRPILSWVGLVTLIRRVTMKTTFKTLAMAGVLAAGSAPAFADGHLSTSMSCEEYNQLSGAVRDQVAMMAITEMNNDSASGDGTATATASSEGTAAEESTTGTGGTSATATSVAGAGDDMARIEEEMGVLNRVCSRNWDATVQEAAAGQFGTR